MRRVGLALAGLLILLVACTPRAVPEATRNGDVVTVTVTTEAALYDANLHLFNATTEDERCYVLNVVDAGCELGDIAAGGVVTVQAVGAVGEVYCMLYGYGSPGDVKTFRPYPCRLNFEGGV